MKRKQGRVAALFLLPYMIVFTVFRLGPSIAGLFIGFMKWNIAGIPRFAGLENFKRLFTDQYFMISLWNTFKFFILTLPPLIILLDELLRESNATSDSMGFSQLIFVDQALINQDTNSSGGSSDNASEANEGSDMELLELNIQSMSIQAPLFGKYEEIMDFVSRLENLNRTTVINGLQLTKGTDGNVSGTIGLDFYSMNKLTEDPMDESYLEWSYSTPKGIDNPFKFIPLESSEVDEPPVEGTPGEEINEAVPGTP